jgi:hypothetical protein
MVAVCSILGWILLFKGLMPVNVIVTRTDFVPEVQRNIWSLYPNNGLYFLCFIGLYFVILEAILFREGIVLRYAQKPQALLIAWLVAILFFIFTPSEGHGGLPVLLRWLPGTSFDTSILYTLGLLVCIRFCRINLAFWMLLTNWLVMTKAYPWDKYALPLLAILWYLKATDTLDEPTNKLQAE